MEYCPQCSAMVDLSEPYQPVENGKAMALLCKVCHHVVRIRPRTEDDSLDSLFTEEELNKMKFIKSQDVEKDHNNWQIEPESLDSFLESLLTKEN